MPSVLFSLIPSSTPRPCFVNSQLVSLSPVVILNSLLYLQYLVIYLVSPISTSVLNTLYTWRKLLLLCKSSSVELKKTLKILWVSFLLETLRKVAETKPIP